MALESELLANDPAFEAAATSDAGHIGPGASGPHVAKIQQALNQLDKAGLKVDSFYGPKTEAAVAKFKSKRPGLTNRAGKIDGIVGIKTTKALDAELPKKGFIGPPNVPPPPRPGPTPGRDVVIIPMSKPIVLAEVITDLNKSDLKDGFPPQPPLSPEEKKALDKSGLENAAAFELELRAKLELNTLAGDLGSFMFNKFKNNQARLFRMQFRQGDQLGNAVLTGSDIKNVHERVRKELDTLLQAQFIEGRVNINSLEATTRKPMQGNRTEVKNPFGIQESPVVDIKLIRVELQAVIGRAFGGGKITVTTFKADQEGYQANLNYQLIDHFGIDNSDMLPQFPHGSQGQIAMWVLQHKHGPGHTPFITTVIYDFPVSGKFTGKK